jgi:branched-chain amino acid transport system substrate-binding protein
VRRSFVLLAATAVFSVMLIDVFSGAASAAENIRIGVLFPLTGNAAAAGQASKAAVEVATDIINGAHPEMGNLPLAATVGLPNLSGARIELVFADHQGNPSVAQSQALRLITQEKVHALYGAYQSSCTLTATAVAERYGVPFVVGDSAALNITGRGFKWIFRVTPIASDYAATYMRFFQDLKNAGRSLRSIAIVNENTDYGTSVADAIEAAANSHKVAVAARIPYSASATDVSAQVLVLKEKQPEVVIFISYTSDSILYLKTMKALDYLPPMAIGDDTGFSDPSFIPAVGDLAQGALNRSAWDIGREGSTTYRINELYRAKTGRDLDDTSGRNMQGFLVLAEAINRAGSTEADKIQASLKATDLKPEQLMMGYRGVKFDATGQNTLAATYLIQLKGKAYVLIWPTPPATAPLEWPMKGWRN